MQKKFSALLFFIFTMAYANAGWDETGRSIDGVSYVDVSTILSRNGISRITTLMDFLTQKSANGTTHLSTKSILEFDCQRKLVSTAQLTLYSNHMARGDIVFTHNYTPKWNSFSDNGSDILHYKIACGLVVKKQ